MRSTKCPELGLFYRHRVRVLCQPLSCRFDNKHRRIVDINGSGLSRMRNSAVAADLLEWQSVVMQLKRNDRFPVEIGIELNVQYKITFAFDYWSVRFGFR